MLCPKISANNRNGNNIMNLQTQSSSNEVEITQLFTTVFSNSEGEDEGKLIGDLARKLSKGIDQQNIFCFAAYEEGTITGVIFFSRLDFNKKIEVFMLAPVAVSTDHQGQGIGQALINYGLQELKSRSVDVAITYGDPTFYSKIGFSPLSEEVIQAPLKLSMPEGWLGQSLKNSQIPKLSECPICVKEFNNPVYW